MLINGIPGFKPSRSGSRISTLKHFVVSPPMRWGEGHVAGQQRSRNEMTGLKIWTRKNNTGRYK